ncbi:MAG: acyl-[acyl-carrier-protein]--UDP-N-acetylglucosamine O-acyltransferase [Bacteroidales bacterium]|nr:MAG: acyl-[acyl-carrier-protein]--UDP-N-acetylglucosamine O-acyltransferase [Bacteroidales bacterium]
MMISELSIIHNTAKIGKNVVVEPFVVIGENVVIGDNTILMSGSKVLKNTVMGANNKVYHSAVIGGDPQDLKYLGEDTFLEIGDNNMFREFVTVNRGTASRGKTVIGNNCLVMAYCHIAHDCVLKNNIIMSNSVQLAGEVELDDFAIIGGGSLVHQFSKIGKHSMIQGGSQVNKDIPPYIIAARHPIAYAGANSVGLKRRGFSTEVIDDIKSIYRIIFTSDMNVSNAVEYIIQNYESSIVRDEIVSFIKSSDRGILKG